MQSVNVRRTVESWWRASSRDSVFGPGIEAVFAQVPARVEQWREILRERNDVEEARRVLQGLVIDRLDACREERATPNITNTQEQAPFGVPFQHILASLVPATWNRIARWLSQIDEIRHAA